MDKIPPCPPPIDTGLSFAYAKYTEKRDDLENNVNLKALHRNKNRNISLSEGDKKSQKSYIIVLIALIVYLKNDYIPKLQRNTTKNVIFYGSKTADSSFLLLLPFSR